MDPSEFEDTVERGEGVLDAGALELLLQKKTFNAVDVSQEIGDLYLSIYSLKESLVKYEESTLSSVVEESDSKAVTLSELREKYLSGRKVLTAQVKKFTQEYLSHPDEEEAPIATDSRAVIESFKKEFDGLSHLSKFAEASFVTLYKSVRELPDPAVVTSESLQVCLKAHEVLEKAQEQLQIADDILKEDGDGGVTPANNAHVLRLQMEVERIAEEKEASEENLKHSYLAEVSNIKSQLQSEMRKRETELTSNFEKRQLELQKQCDVAIAKKDSEIDSLLRSLNEYQQANLEADERAKLLDVEMSNRRELEDKWRASLLSISDLTSTNQDLTGTVDALRSQVCKLEESLETQDSSHAKRIAEMKEALKQAADEKTSLEAQLAVRPPVDMTRLMNKIGNVVALDHARLRQLQQQQRSNGSNNKDDGDDNDDSSDINNSDNDSSNGSGINSGGAIGVGSLLSWSHVESYIVETVRKSDAEATQGRIAEQESARQAKELGEQCERLQQQLSEKTLLVAALERDVLHAHQHVSQLEQQLQQQQKGMMIGGSDQSSAKNGASSTSSYNNKPSNPLSKEDAYLVDLLSSTTTRTTSDSSSNSSGANRVHDDKNNIEASDVEQGGSNAIATVTSSNDRGNQTGSHAISSNNHSILNAVQSQRDRYMKSVTEKDAELTAMKVKYERLQDEQEELRNENLELYRRLRVLRVSSGNSSSSASSSSSAYSSIGSPSGVTLQQDFSVRSRNASSSYGGISNNTSKDDSNSRGGGMGDALDAKYMNLYQQEIDPFRMEQFDKQVVLSRLNIFEQGLVYINKHVLQDRCARHALLAYLVFVHLLALIYVWKVLNPELIDEVDAHMRSKWSAETFKMEEHPDIE